MMIPMPFWKQDAAPSFDGLRILLNMANFQDVLDAPADVDWVDQDLTDGQANDVPMIGGNGASPIAIAMGAAFGGWEDVVPGNGGTRDGEVVMTPVGAREYTIEMDFMVDGTAGDSVQMWLFQLTHSGFQLVARVLYNTGTDAFTLYGGFNSDSDTVALTKGATHNLVVNVYDDAGTMKADYILDSTPVFTLTSGNVLSEISSIQVVSPLLTAASPTGAGLDWGYGGFALETTT
jgi:hypothetical protein